MAEHVAVMNDGKADEAVRIARAKRTRLIVKIAPLCACATLMILYTVCASAMGYSLSVGYQNIIANVTLVALLSTGASFIFTAGSFDLSLGSNMLVSALLGGLVGNATQSVWAMLLVCVVCAVAISVTNSVLASVFNIPVFIETIAMMSVLSSVATLIINQLGSAAAIKVTRSLVADFNHVWFRLALLAVFEILSCIIFYWLKTGRKQKFLGGNPTCAVLSGIHAKRLTILCFVLAGLGIGLASFAMIVATPTLSSASGSSVGMNMLVALVFGGMDMSGGPKSKVYAALLGALSMAFLDAFMNLFVTGDWYLQIVKGVLFLLVVTLINLNNRGKLLRR